MESKKTTAEVLFSANGQTDSKHILNTCNKPVDDKILRDIEDNGVTIEQLNSLQKNGFDVFKYQTQITIHGVFSKLLVNYLNGYKNLFQNKNLSIGVKWNAIDSEKKERIYSLCNLVGWHTEKNSSEYCIFRQCRVNSKSEAIEKSLEYKELTKNIDPSLFYGGVSIYMQPYFGMYYVVCTVTINGIFENNVNKVTEQITGKTMQELTELWDAKILAQQKENERYELERIERDRLQKIANEESKIRSNDFIEKHPLNGFERSTDAKIVSGMICAKINRDSTGYNFYGFKKIGASMCKFKCDIDGNKLDKAGSYPLATISGLIKTSEPTPKKEPIKQTVSASTIVSVKVVPYSEKSFAVVGDTKPIKEILKSLGGCFNSHLACGIGWIFPISKMQTVSNFLNL